MGNSFVLFRVRVLLVLLAALFLVGCESGETSTSDSASGGGRSFDGLTTHSFAREVNLSVQRNEFSAPNSPFIEITAENEQAYRQFEEVRSQISNDRFVQLNYSVRDGVGEGYELLTDDPSGELTAYTPRSAEDTVFDGVYDKFGSVFLVRSSENGVGQFSCTVTYDWTLPADDSERPTLVSVNGVGITFGDYAAESPQYAEAEGDTVQLVYDITGSTTATAIEEYSWTATVNGTTVGEGTSGQVSQLILPPPAFKSTVSGLHQVTTTSSGSSNVIEVGLTQPDDTYSWSYYQRGLVFTEEFPEVDLESEEPITIENTVAWSDDVPLVDFVTWEVYSTAGVGFNRIGGTGNEILAVWDPVEGELTRPRAAEEGEEPKLEPVPFEVSASTTVYDGPQHADREALVYRLVHGPFDMPGLEKLRILTPDVTPDNPFQGDVQSVQVVADIILFDEESTESDVAWEVHIVDSAGEPVKENIASGRGCQIMAAWDGTAEDGSSVPDPASHQFLLEASLCGGGIVAGRSVQGVRAQSTCDNLKDFDTRLAQMGDTSILRVYNAAGDLLASSDDGENTLAMQKQVFPFGRKDNDNNIKITVEGLEESLQSVSVELEGVLSATPDTATLTYNSEEKVHQGTFEVTNSLIRIGQLQKDGLSVNTTFSDSVLPATGGAQVIFENALANFQGLPYLPAQVQLGTFQENSDPGTASLDQKNVINFGFETLNLALQTGGSAKTKLKVRHPASVFYFLQHMYPTGEIVLGTTSLSPSGLTKEDATPLQTLIFTACSGLVLNDYNNRWFDLHGLSASLSERQDVGFGGRKWAAATEGATLLGYNFYAPAKLADDIIDEYITQLKILKNKVGQGEHLEALAWMQANRNLLYKAQPNNPNAEQFRVLCINACAYQGGYYYYMPLDIVNRPATRTNFLSSGRQIHRVSVDDWNNPLDSQQWLQTPKPKSKEVLIP